MHGMAEHGVMQHGSAAVVGMQQVASESQADLSAKALVDVTAQVGTRVAAVLATADDPGQSTGAAMLLCLTVLTALLLFLSRGHRARAGFLLLARARPRDVRLLSRARAPDPPDLFALSIQRC